MRGGGANSSALFRYWFRYSKVRYGTIRYGMVRDGLAGMVLHRVVWLQKVEAMSILASALSNQCTFIS